jgi:magnesium chelatase family protein
LIGGGPRARPGEISLAHQGVLFLDELVEFNRAALEALRQPLETGRVSIARANGHVTYPARFQLIAAMNPCRCGHFAELPCGRAPRCAEEYQGRLSGPLLDRIDLRLEVPAMAPADLALPPAAEGSAAVADRVMTARARQAKRYSALPRELVSEPTPRRMGPCSTRSRRRSRPAAPCFAGQPSGCAFRRAATIACCASRVPWPTSKARRSSPAATSPRRSATAR